MAVAELLGRLGHQGDCGLVFGAAWKDQLAFEIYEGEDFYDSFEVVVVSERRSGLLAGAECGSIQKDMLKLISIVVDDFLKLCPVGHDIRTHCFFSLLQLLKILSVAVTVPIDQIADLESNRTLKQLIQLENIPRNLIFLRIFLWLQIGALHEGKVTMMTVEGLSTNFSF